MTAPIIQLKRGASANLPGLRAGEPGFTTDKYDLYCEVCPGRLSELMVNLNDALINMEHNSRA